MFVFNLTFLFSRVFVVYFQGYYKQETEGDGSFGVKFCQLQSAASEGAARRTE